MNKLDIRWQAISSDPARSVFQLYDASHALDFYLGKSSSDQRLLLLVTAEEPPPMRDMRVVRVEKYRREDGRWSLLLTLSSPSLTPMFTLLCNDLIESSRGATANHNKSLQFLLQRLSNWRRLLERAVPDVLSESAIRGLCGELLFLNKLMRKIDAREAVTAWVGPNEAEQDFQIPEQAWEVKTVRPGAPSVKISSEAQLSTLKGTVSLVVLELADSVPETAHAFTLNSLVEDLRMRLLDDFDTGEVFEERLFATGYVSREEYNEFVLVERSLALYEVTENFPRIAGEALPVGIKRVSYELSLAACEAHRVDADSYFI